MFNDLNAIAKRKAMEARVAKEAAMEESEKRVDQRTVNDWLARYHTARNARCEGQKNFRGIGQ